MWSVIALRVEISRDTYRIRLGHVTPELTRNSNYFKTVQFTYTSNISAHSNNLSQTQQVLLKRVMHAKYLLSQSQSILWSCTTCAQVGSPKGSVSFRLLGYISVYIYQPPTCARKTDFQITTGVVIPFLVNTHYKYNNYEDRPSLNIFFSVVKSGWLLSCGWQ